MLILLALWAATCGFAVLGWRVGARSKLAATSSSAGCVLLLISGALLARNQHWLPYSFICAPLASIEFAWFTPPAAFLFALGARQAELRTGRKTWLMKLFVILLAGFSTLRVADQQGWLLGNIGASPANIDADNVVRQNSSSTCGAASCATLLRHLRIDPDATEAKMIPLCGTGIFGSTSFGMAVGLKSVAEPLGWHVQILKCDWQEFVKRRQPAVVSLREGFTASHAVAVIGFKENLIQIADPLAGMSWWSIGEFKRLFSGDALVLKQEQVRSQEN